MTNANHYYNANSSKSIEVQIDLDENLLSLIIVNSEEPQEQIAVWKFSDIETENYKEYVVVKNKISNDSLYINNLIDVEKLKKQFQKNGFVNNLFNTSPITKIGIGIGTIIILIVSYVYLLPMLSDAIISQLPKSYDKQIGEIAFQNLYYKEYENFEKSKQLNEFYHILKKEDYSRDIEFIVLDQEIFNAYALPNGKVFIYQEMLDSISNPSELIALMGHEVAHVNNRHSMRMIGKNISSYLIISLVLSDANGFIALMAENASGIYNLKYSREFEQESDEEAAKLLKLNRADMNASTNLFKKLKSKTEGFDIPTFITTHPHIDERIKSASKYKNELPVMIRPGINYYFERIKAD